MGWLSVFLSGIAAFLLFKTGHTILMILSIVAAIGSLWSWGIMHNSATELAKRRANYTGGFYDITDQEAQSVPDWINIINIVFSLVGFVLLFTGIVMMTRK
ncbi:MAG: hypothetical protein L6425_04775 [Candidatus Aminicenantes bacterium]|nr:hypothetical protein [Candidatus Aminicenantes bacterium]